MNVSHLSAAARAALLEQLEDLRDATITELPPADERIYACCLSEEAKDALPDAQLTACYLVTLNAFGREYTRIRVQLLGARKPIQWNEQEGKWCDVR